MITLEKHKDVECVLNCLALSAIIDQTKMHMIGQEFFSVACELVKLAANLHQKKGSSILEEEELRRKLSL